LALRLLHRVPPLHSGGSKKPLYTLVSGGTSGTKAALAATNARGVVLGRTQAGGG
jgi:hypothetical protein